jgi:molecular chaperone DnaK
VLLDVTSLSLGVETYDGKTAVVIPRNTTIPTEAMRTFTTARQNQTSVVVHVVQGEQEEARSNDSLGRFNLDGIHPAPAPSPQIDVTFTIDLDGMVKVSARDRDSGGSRTVSVSVRKGGSSEHAPTSPATPSASRSSLRAAGARLYG